MLICDVKALQSELVEGVAKQDQADTQHTQAVGKADYLSPSVAAPPVVDFQYLLTEGTESSV